MPSPGERYQSKAQRQVQEDRSRLRSSLVTLLAIDFLPLAPSPDPEAERRKWAIAVALKTFHECEKQVASDRVEAAIDAYEAALRDGGAR